MVGIKEFGPMYKPWRMPLKKWQVHSPPMSLDEGTLVHTIEAHYCFNNPGEGLVFRRYPKGEDKSTVVAAFAPGAWNFYKEIEDDQ